MNKGASDMTNSMALPPGTELGEYTIIRKLGQGGFGITYLAHDNNNNCDVVIKENLPSVFAFRSDTCLNVRPHGDGEPEDNYRWALQRFCDEAQTINKLSHPNIVRVLRAFKALGTAYYVMPYVKGESLSNIYKTSAQVTGECLLAILKPILSALAYLHSKGVMHRDLKPANILIKDEETPILIDFGAARSYIGERSATLVGTPGYSPVEQVTPNGKCGPWTDLYALGATCYRLIKDETPPDALSRVYNTDPYVPLSSDSALCRRYPRELLKTIDKALRIDASKRWQTADEWLAALSPERMKKGSSCGSLATTAAIVALLATAGGSAWYYYSTNGQQTNEKEEQVEGRRKPTPPQDTDEEQVNTQARTRLAELGIVEAEYNAKLGDAADNSDNEKLGLLIAAGADVNFDMADNWTPLTTVCLNQNIVGLQLLLNAPAIDVNKQNRRGDTALIWSAVKGHLEAVRLLLAVPGINVNFIDNDGKTAYDWAVSNKHEECAEFIRNNGGKTAAEIQGTTEQPSANATTTDEQAKTAAREKLRELGINEEDYNAKLGEAADNNDNEKIALLIAAGADVNFDTADNWTPLTTVCFNQNLVGLKLLLNAPAIDVNKQNRRGDTALIWSAVKGPLEAVRLLLAVPGINVNFIDSDGKTAYEWADASRNEECAQLIRNNGGKTAAEIQSATGQPSSDAATAKARLQEAGITEGNYNEALCQATDNSDNEKIRLLIDAGADVNCDAADGFTPITNVCLNGNAEGLRMLLSAPSIDVNQPNKRGDNAIIWAAVRGHTECLRMLLAVPGINVNFIDSDDKTAFDWAMENNHAECVKILQEAGGRTNNRDREEAQRKLQNLGISPSQYNEAICKATDNSDNEKLLLLIAAGANVNTKAEDGWMPLTNLCYYDNQEGLRFILRERSLDVNASDGKGNNALTLAAAKGRLGCLRQLLRHSSIRVNECDANGRLPLIQAVAAGHLDCVILLLNHSNLDINARNRNGDTALVWAAAKGNTDILKALLRKSGIDLDVIDGDGKTAYDWAVNNNNNECAELLRNAGARTAAQVRAGGKTRPAANNTNANTQLCDATDNGNNSKIRQALEDGADVNFDADDGWTPLTNVAFFGHEESMRILLAAPGIDVNKLNKKGNHALMLAAQKGHANCIRLLLAAPGIDVNLQNEKGDTALIWAAVKGKTECVRLLLAAPGININYVDRDGCTALDWAEKNNHTECARLLREAGAKKANQL